MRRADVNAAPDKVRPRVGDIYRIKARQDNGIGPVFIRVVRVCRGNGIHVIDYMKDGQLASERHEPWRGPRLFFVGALKHWRLLPAQGKR